MEVLEPDFEAHNNLASNEKDSECNTNSGAECFDKEDEDFLVNVVEVEEGKWKTCFHVDNIFYKCIRKTIERIKSETETDVSVPGRKQKGDIVIIGADKFNVVRARKRIKLIQKTEGPLTHFLSIPINNETFQQNFLIFKDKVLESCHETGINESLFQSEHRLHLTLGVLILCDDIDKSEACRILEECKVNIVNPLLSEKSLLLEMSGIGHMKTNPAKVTVVYGKVLLPENPEILQQLVDSIVKYFMDKGIMRKQRNRVNVKLHVTLMNASFIRGKRIRTFDATEIIKNFGDFYFGKAFIERIDLSLMPSMTPSTGKCSYYEAASSISLA
ncbi:hypothetical protein O3M35_009361 [Rhynocoris fuscipes]|uniref:A-kinase anchor protein 7-like phosphoesterase domain-containing protein n=1 Tax=Rhynocoris fuscipes TaxID=488301 RepID=A0AAW1D662_9HEMI